MKKVFFLFAILVFTSVAYANTEKDLTELVHYWNALHNNRSVDEFRVLFADRVLYYGRDYSGEKCYQRKKAFLTPAFQQEIISPVTFTYYSSGTIKCSFTKRVTIKKRVNEHLCYLLVEKRGSKYVISGESDLLTDQNLGVHLELGKEVSPPGKRMVLYLSAGVFLLIGGSIALYRRRQKLKQAQAFSYDPSYEPAVEQQPVLLVEQPQSVIVEEDIVKKVRMAVMEDIKGMLPEERLEKKKGDAFEKFIVERFKKEYFELLEWRGDKYHEGRYAASNKLPDLEYRFRTSYYDLRLAVECKWRAGFNNGRIEWAKDYQLSNYRQYERKESVFVFVIIGVGGQPDNPESLYIIPLREIRSNILTLYQMRKHQRFGHGDFFLNADKMMLK